MHATQLQAGLRGSREALFASIRGLTEEQFRFAPAGETWDIATHLAHLLRIERLFAVRARAALEQEEPYMPSTRAANEDEPGRAQHLAAPQIIHGMLNARRDLEGVLAECDDVRLERAIVHERLGRMTVRDIAVKMAQHESEHAAEVVKLARQAPPSGRVILPLTQRSQDRA